MFEMSNENRLSLEGTSTLGNKLALRLFVTSQTAAPQSDLYRKKAACWRFLALPIVSVSYLQKRRVIFINLISSVYNRMELRITFFFFVTLMSLFYIYKRSESAMIYHYVDQHLETPNVFSSHHMFSYILGKRGGGEGCPVTCSLEPHCEMPLNSTL